MKQNAMKRNKMKNLDWMPKAQRALLFCAVANTNLQIAFFEYGLQRASVCCGLHNE